MTRLEELVITLWNKGLSVQSIAQEARVDYKDVERIIDNPSLYGITQKEFLKSLAISMRILN